MEQNQSNSKGFPIELGVFGGFLFHVEQTKPRNPDFSDKNIRAERIFSISVCVEQGRISARAPSPLSEVAAVDWAFHSV